MNIEKTINDKILKFVKVIIHSNVYISLAAVFLTIETQIQLGMAPQVHPYLFIIFFATLFEYNLHRLITILSRPEALNGEKHHWVKQYPHYFYALVVLSTLGFLISVVLAKRQVILILSPFALITIFYSFPYFKRSIRLYRLRDIPFLKIFLIALVWSSATILLPIVQSTQTFDRAHVTWMLIERFLFVFAITIPFDIRDMQTDLQQGLKTIPIVVGKERSLKIANAAILLLMLICTIHYSSVHQTFVLYALLLSAIITLFVINSKKLPKMNLYHYGLLDGTMLLQGLLVLLFYFIHLK